MDDRMCPACGKEGGFVFAVRDFRHLRCGTCRSLFVSPLPSTSLSRATYLEPEYHAGAPGAAARMQAEAVARARHLARLGCKRVLEIGCGPGHFMDACRSLQLEVEAVDPAATADRARSHGHKVHAKFIEDFCPPHRYDAIAMWEVLEHLPHPKAALQRLHQWLRPHGVLALSTPSISGLTARVLGQRFPMITPPDHLALFSRRGLEQLLVTTKFAPVRWSSFSGLGRSELERGFRRYLLGDSRLGALGARVLSKLSQVPVKWIDHRGLGTSFEVYAAARR